ncbi:MAG: hypothetical protein JWO12_3649 [Frankiales bacterium]|jgi:hypothetical protein|nr:hypothetical protein [Frankiales bacterium]
MAVSRAHLLLQADPGRANEVASYVAALQAVTGTVVTSGPYDVIATVETTEDMSRLLAETKRAPGLSRLCVCRPA